MTTLIDYSGTRHGMLYVSHHKPKKPGCAKNIKTIWVCTCDCGNKVELRAKQIKQGRTDCGCVVPLVRHYNKQHHITLNTERHFFHELLNSFLIHYRSKYVSLRTDQWHETLPEARYCQIPPATSTDRMEICLRGMR